MSAYSSVMCDLLLSQSMLISLPSIKFFEPKESFCQFMRDRYTATNPVIYDVGAGCGQVSSRLAREGLRVIPIDINVRAKTEVSVLVGNGVDFPYDRDSIVMVCRPCHGPTTEFYIRNAIERQSSEVLYVGKSKNASCDLGRYRRRFKRVLANVGHERESVYLMWIK
jgi:hypothetical protein